jgi:predicted nuclease of predicted toxin-antitoxin system
MKFIVDAQLPYGIALFLREKGFDALHTNDLPDKERTSDSEIRCISVSENRIVITKDYDFVDSQILMKIPEKLLLVTTGNIKNRQLFDLWRNNWELVIHLFETWNFVRLSREDVVAQ